MNDKQKLILIDVDGVVLPLQHDTTQISKKYHNSNYYFSEYFIKLLDELKDSDYTIKWFSYWEEETVTLNKILDLNWEYVSLINDKKETLNKIIIEEHEQIILIDDEEFIIEYPNFTIFNINGDYGINEIDYVKILHFLKSMDYEIL